MQRLQLEPTPRNVSIAVTAAILLGYLAFAASRPADATDPPMEEVPAENAVVADSVTVDLSTASSDDADTTQAPVAESEERADPVEDSTATEPAPSAVATPARAQDSSTRRYRAGEDPAFAEAMGWPVEGPEPLPGAILPDRRIVAYYGNPLSTRMGVLGEYPKDEMLRRFREQVDEWRRADPDTPVQPALHLVAVVAQGDSGPSGKYRTIMRDTLIEQVYRWAQEAGAILFIDIQVGLSDIREILPRFDHFLSRPDVHLAIDPEFMMKTGHVPGTKIGSMDAADINYAAEYLARLVREHDLPPKVLVIHRFTRGMVTNSANIELRPEVQIVMHMDGWGAPWLKRDSYRDYIVREPVQYTGFKLFYHNDTKNGDPLMTPEDVLRLRPQPLYIQYQ